MRRRGARERSRRSQGRTGFGRDWNFSAVTVGAEFRTVAWHRRYETTTMYLLQLTFGLGGWYAVGRGEDSGSWLYH